MANARRIKYLVKGYDVTVADSFGDVLVVYADVPALSKEDAAEMVRKRLSISAEQAASNQMCADKTFAVVPVNSYWYREDLEFLYEPRNKNKV
jgi:hypothetical protein